MFRRNEVTTKADPWGMMWIELNDDKYSFIGQRCSSKTTKEFVNRSL